MARQVVETATLFSDDFNSSLNSACWDYNSGKDDSFYGRTQQRDALPVVSNGVLHLELETFNPANDPNNPNHKPENPLSFYGSEVITRETFSPVELGIAFEIKAHLVNPAGGIVGGMFSYRVISGKIHDEIDFEALSNRPNQIQTNIYENEPTGAGHPQFTTISSAVTEDHIYRIEWFKDSVQWFVDGQLVREQTDNVPQQPMALHLNIWAPAVDWTEAFSGTLNPVTNASANEAYFFDIDSVRVARLSTNNDTSEKYSLPGFDKAYYLNAKLTALQATPGTAETWTGEDTGYLENVLTSYGFTAESHYMTYGYKEGLAPNAYFNAAEYEQAKATDMFNHGNGAYLSIAAAKTDFEAKWPYDPYQHYLKYGAKEGINPSNSFDESSYYDIKLAKLLADPSTATEWSGKTVTDLKALFDSLDISPLQHYLTWGINEGISVTAVPAHEQVHINLIGVSPQMDFDQSC